MTSAQELRNAVAHDPLVAALYADFDLSKARVVRLTNDRELYVSYRWGGHIYWTKKRLLLPAGETVITDGQHEARTRCGNRVSETPRQPVRPDEPSDATLNAPPMYPLFAENSESPLTVPVDSVVADPISPGMQFFPQPSTPISTIPPPYFPIVGGGPPSFPNIIPPPIPPPPPLVATPEPGALSMLGLGLLWLAALAGTSTLVKNRKAESNKP